MTLVGEGDFEEGEGMTIARRQLKVKRRFVGKWNWGGFVEDAG